MHARALEQSAAQLHELRREEWEDLGIAALFLSLAVAATGVHPSLGLPLLIGGLLGTARGVRALWRHWDLLDRLVGERDAQVIPEVRARALRDATPRQRRALAASLRRTLKDPGAVLADRTCDAAEDLETLADELDDETLTLEPTSAVACRRLLMDPASSPLLNPALPREALYRRIRDIRAGFGPRTPAS